MKFRQSRTAQIGPLSQSQSHTRLRSGRCGQQTPRRRRPVLGELVCARFYSVVDTGLAAAVCKHYQSDLTLTFAAKLTAPHLRLRLLLSILPILPLNADSESHHETAGPGSTLYQDLLVLLEQHRTCCHSFTLLPHSDKHYLSNHGTLPLPTRPCA